MTPALARRLGRTLALLGSPVDGEALGAARAAGRLLASAGLAWVDVGRLLAVEASRQAAPAFTFATTGPRAARKLMAHLARQPGVTAPDRARLECLRERLLTARLRKPLTRDEIA